MKKILEERDDVVFFIKLLPLKIHPASYAKSKSIVCEKSVRLLERAFDGWNIPDPQCETTEVDETIELAERLGITGTPTVVLPDGAVVRGFKDSATLLRMIEEAGVSAMEKGPSVEGKDIEEISEPPVEIEESPAGRPGTGPTPGAGASP